MRTKVDEVVRNAARRDPRREESEPPPSAGPRSAPQHEELPTVPPTAEAISLRELAVPSDRPPEEPSRAATDVEGAHASDVEVAPHEAPPASAREIAAIDVDQEAPLPKGSEPDRSRAHAPAAVTSLDPRLEAIEPAISAGEWASVAKQLGPDDQAGRLPPNLGLLYALARKEAEHDGEQRRGVDTNELAIRCMAGLFGVPEQSPIALVLAKRLLRRNPVSWQKRPAPPAKVSLFFIALAIVIGGGIGWAISMGYVRFR